MKRNFLLLNFKLKLVILFHLLNAKNNMFIREVTQMIRQTAARTSHNIGREEKNSLPRKTPRI